MNFDDAFSMDYDPAWKKPAATAPKTNARTLPSGQQDSAARAKSAIVNPDPFSVDVIEPVKPSSNTQSNTPSNQKSLDASQPTAQPVLPAGMHSSRVAPGLNRIEPLEPEVPSAFSIDRFGQEQGASAPGVAEKQEAKEADKPNNFSLAEAQAISNASQKEPAQMSDKDWMMDFLEEENRLAGIKNNPQYAPVEGFGLEQADCEPVQAKQEPNRRTVSDARCVDFLYALLDIYGREIGVLNSLNLSMESSLDKRDLMMIKASQKWRETLEFLSESQIDGGLNACRNGVFAKMPSISEFARLCSQSRDPRQAFIEAANLSAIFLNGSEQSPHEVWKDATLYEAARMFGFNAMRSTAYDNNFEARKSWEHCLSLAEAMQRAGRLTSVPVYEAKPSEKPADQDVAKAAAEALPAPGPSPFEFEKDLHENDPMFWTVRVLLGQHKQSMAALKMAMDALEKSGRHDIVMYLKREGIELDAKRGLVAKIQ